MLSPMEAINLIFLEIVTMLSLSLTITPQLTFVAKLNSKIYELQLAKKIAFIDPDSSLH